MLVGFVTCWRRGGEDSIPVSGVQWSFCAVLGVRTPELGAAGAFVSWASSRAMVVVVVGCVVAVETRGDRDQSDYKGDEVFAA